MRELVTLAEIKLRKRSLLEHALAADGYDRIKLVAEIRLLDMLAKMKKDLRAGRRKR